MKKTGKIVVSTYILISISMMKYCKEAEGTEMGNMTLSG